jgi:hypothetical protein
MTDKHAPRKPSGKYTPERKKAEQRRGGPPPSAHVESQPCPFTGVCDCYRAVEQEGYILAEIVNCALLLCEKMEWCCGMSARQNSLRIQRLSRLRSNSVQQQSSIQVFNSNKHNKLN